MSQLAQIVCVACFAACVYKLPICASQESSIVTPSSERVLPLIKVSEDGSHFVKGNGDDPFVLWGVNYDHDDSGRLLEDYWDDEWQTVVQDFHEMKALGANVVRIHLQISRFIDAPDRSNADNFARLGKLVRLAEEIGLYLDVTGLGCYHKQDIPHWYDALPESKRWDVQAKFWQETAKVCHESPAIFCYDLMNEPILPGDKQPESKWVAGELNGKHFVQRIALDLAGRGREEVARDWVKQLTSAIREIDRHHLITVGVIPWAYVFKGAKPLFYSEEVAGPLDFVSVHFYPKSDDLDDALAALSVYELGKPLVVEEIFPINCGTKETGNFIHQSRIHADGWISFYWGATADENRKKGGISGAIVGEWLDYFRAQGPKLTKSPQE